MTGMSDIVERAIEITPLLQSQRSSYNESFVKWGNPQWQTIPSAWQPASDPDDEWMEAELATGVL